MPLSVKTVMRMAGSTFLPLEGRWVSITTPFMRRAQIPPGHYTYLNSHFCSKFTLDSTGADMSKYSRRRCPFLCCKLGVTQKPLSPYTGPITSSRSAGTTVKKYGSAYFIFLLVRCPFDANNNSQCIYF